MIDGLSLTWPWNPGVLIFVLVLALLYLLGLRQVGKRVEEGTEEKPVSAPYSITFFLGLVIMALVTLTPVDTVARTQLFSVHMAQLVLLTTLCAPLLLFGSPASLLRPLIELPGIRDVIRILTRPIVASLLFNIIFLLWHAPRIFHVVVGNSTLYHVHILTIFVASLLNWWPLIGSLKTIHRMSYPMQMLYAFFDGQPVDIFAFILVFSGTTIYPFFAVPQQSGISPFGDQAVGGALLLIPGLVDLLVMSPFFFKWLGLIEQQSRLADQNRQEEYENDEVEEIEEISEA